METEKWRTQSGIYLQKLVYTHISSYLEQINKYIAKYKGNKLLEQEFQENYGFKPKKIKLVDFTDIILFDYFRATALYSSLDPEYEENELFFEPVALTETLLKTNYKGLPRVAFLYSERSNRNLYINTKLLADIKSFSEVYFPRNIGGEARLVNEIFKSWFIFHKIAKTRDFISESILDLADMSDYHKPKKPESIEKINDKVKIYLELHSSHLDYINPQSA